MRACPYGDRYAHHFLDLLPECPWDPDSKPRADEPCPLGYGCPVHNADTVTVSNTTGPDSYPIADTAPDSAAERY